jgi:hypothetical protein
MSKQTTLTGSGPAVKLPGISTLNGEVVYHNIVGTKIRDSITNYLLFGEFIMEEQGMMPRKLLSYDLRNLVCRPGQNVIFQCTLCKSKFKVTQGDNRVRMNGSVLGHLHDVHGVVPYDHLTDRLKKRSFASATYSEPTRQVLDQAPSDLSFVKFFVGLNLPINAVANPVFRLFCSLHGIPSPPSRSTLSRMVTAEVMNSAARNAAELVAALEPIRVVLEQNGVKSMHQFYPGLGISIEGVSHKLAASSGYLTMVAAVMMDVDDRIFIKSVPLAITKGGGAHTPDGINRAVHDALTKNGISPERLTGVCDDGAPSVRAAFAPPETLSADPPEDMERIEAEFQIDSAAQIDAVVGLITRHKVWQTLVVPIVDAVRFAQSNKKVWAAVKAISPRFSRAPAHVETKMYSAITEALWALPNFPQLQLAERMRRTDFASPIDIDMGAFEVNMARANMCDFSNACLVVDILSFFTVVIPYVEGEEHPTLGILPLIPDAFAEHAEKALANARVKAEKASHDHSVSSRPSRAVCEYRDFCVKVLRGHLLPYTLKTEDDLAHGPCGLVAPEVRNVALASIAPPQTAARIPARKAAVPDVGEPVVAKKRRTDGSAPAAVVTAVATASEAAASVADPRVPENNPLQMKAASDASGGADPKILRDQKSSAPRQLAARFLDPYGRFDACEMVPVRKTDLADEKEKEEQERQKKKNVLHKEQALALGMYLRKVVLKAYVPQTQSSHNAGADLFQSCETSQSTPLATRELAELLRLEIGSYKKLTRDEIDRKEEWRPSALIVDKDLPAGTGELNDKRRSNFWSMHKLNYPLLYVASLIILLGPAQMTANKRVHSVLRRVLANSKSSETALSVENLTLFHYSIMRQGESLLDKNGASAALDGMEFEQEPDDKADIEASIGDDDDSEDYE